MNTLKDWTDPAQTKRHVLPYEFIPLPNGKVCILKTNGQRLHVTRRQVEQQLQRDDLDVHRRRMYEAALKAFPQVQQ